MENKKIYAVAVVFHQRDEKASRINTAIRLTCLQARSEEEAFGLALVAIENNEPDFKNNGWEINLRAVMNVLKQ